MRLQLAAALAASALVACVPVRGELARAGAHLYTDPSATVRSPRADATVRVGDGTRVSPYWTADVITAATPVLSAPDVVSRATEYAEIRHEIGVGVEHQTRQPGAWSASYTASIEPDYQSHSATARLEREVLNRQSTPSLGVRGGYDRIGRSDDPGFGEQQWLVGWNTGWTQILNRRLTWSLVYDGEWSDGFQENPYRYVPVSLDAGTGRPERVAHEALPSQRHRHAVETALVWGAPSHVWLHAGARLYGDDWGIWSHATQLELWRPVADERVRLRWQARFYQQTAARFQRVAYEGGERYRTGDYRLGPMMTASAGIGLDVRLGRSRRWTLGASYGLTWFRLSRYAPHQTMLGHLIGTSLLMEIP